MSLPPVVMQPNDDNAMHGLGGTAPLDASMTTPAQEPDPSESAARHIMDALGGSQGHPMDWARGIISGGLAAAANVGKVPEGGGALYGASRAAQAQQATRRQQMLDQQAARQQGFENQLRANADVRAEAANKRAEAQNQRAELNDREQRALWGAETAGMIQRQNEDAAKFEQWKKTAPLEVKEAEIKYQEAQDKLDEAHGEMRGLVEAVSGKSMSDFPLFTSSSDLTQDHANQLGAAYIFPVHNGEKHSAEEDRVGAYMVPGHYWEQPLKKPFEFNTPDGDKMTAQPGTSMATMAGIIMGKIKSADNDQKQIMQKLDVQAKQAQIRHEGIETQNLILSGQLLKKQLEDPDGMTPKEVHSLQKAGQTESSKTQKDYNTFLQSANSIEGSIRAARNGNELASAIIPLQGTLFITTAEGVKRINQTELAGVEGAGDIMRRGENAYQHFINGDTSEGTKRDLAALIEVYKKAKYQQYLNNEEVTAKNYRLGDNQSVFDMNGSPTTLGEARKKMIAETPGMPKAGDTNTYQGAQYKFDGKQWVKQ